MAAGVLAAAHRLGVSVPDRLSVAGFDDTDLAQVVWPSLTTIRQPIRDLGYAAADLLLEFGETIERRQLAARTDRARIDGRAASLTLPIAAIPGRARDDECR